ncbi:hypothetical protein [Winogradskyella sp.]|uniref:hypothetical protein n=1 Tax=Winogradskyella sp. TaxID=1883156 RepID=UPI0025D9D7F3|nr:hypothetical protein [Winogradskyella sp.]
MKSVAYISSIFLMVLIIFNSTRVSLTYAYFELDPIGFIENLCENVDKPELKCNGKCHLKKVAESHNNEQKTPESIIDFKELVLYLNPIIKFHIIQKSNIDKSDSIAYQNLYSFISSKDCFHPPRV